MVKRRMAKSDRMFYKIDRERLWEEQNRRCYHCKEYINRDEITMDHLTPISKLGGQHSVKNCVASCLPCNQHKADNEEWDVSMRLEEMSWIERSVYEFGKRMDERVRRFAWRMDMSPKGSYNKWLRYHQKRGEYLD